ncbi:MAG: penicillin-binding protein, partial [Actinobacteria bacterium]
IVLRLAAVLVVVLFAFVAVAAAAGVAQVQSYLKDLPDSNNPQAFKVAEATTIYSADGKLLARLYLENRTVVPMSDISTDLVHGVVAVEDERFYTHNGVDPQGIMRAAFANIAAGSTQEGASTITQQYVRNTILLDERTDITLARKIREAYLAMQVEKRYGKPEILHMYLNTIYFGEGAYGAEAAAQTYFAKHAKDLTLGQAALLAGLPQSPSRLDPYDNLDGAVARRKEVLDAMLSNNYITTKQHEEALTEKVKLMRRVEPLEGIYGAPFFVSYVKKELQRQYSPAVVFKGGLKVYTTIDMKMQRAAETAAARIKGKNAPEVALVAIDPRTGQIKAMVGGRNYAKSKFNLATQAHRQAGSSFKTFVLVTAIDMGMPPSYRIDSSSPAYIPTKPRPWVVANSEGSGRGLVTLESGTAASINTVYARLVWALGAKKVAQTAKRMGIDSPLGEVPSMALGTKGVTPLEMASAYGTLATNGIHNEATGIAKIVGPDGKVIYQFKPHGKRVLRPQVAYAVTNVLKGVISHGTA